MEHNFTISIVCECSLIHDWMAFASWYSFKKFLPDCKVLLETKLSFPLFQWTHRAGVRIVHKSNSEIKFRPTTMAVRDFVGDFEISSVKSEKQSCFIDYSEGCGNFIIKKWENNKHPPFYKALIRFGRYNKLTVNEFAVLDFWEKCDQIYRTMGGP